MNVISANSIDTLRAVLAGVSDLQGAEICVRSVDLWRCEWARGKQNNPTGRTNESAIGLRLQRANKQVCGMSRGASVDELKLLVNETLVDLEKAPEFEGAALAPMLFEDKERAFVQVDETLRRIPDDEKTRRVQNLAQSVHRECGEASMRLDITYEERRTREWIWTSGASSPLFSDRLRIDIAGRVLLPNLRVPVEASSSIGELTYYDLDWSNLARSMAQLYLPLKEKRPSAIGNFSVVFSPRANVFFLREVFPAFSMLEQHLGESFLTGRLGDRCFSEAVEIIDDPATRKRVGLCEWDDEGTPTSRQVLVKEGHALAFCNNRSLAEQYKQEPSGHGKRNSLAELPGVGFHNLLLEPGSKDQVDLLRDLGSGQYVHEIVQSEKLSPFRFRLTFLMSPVEGGQIGAGGCLSVCEIGVEELFQNVISVGRDLSWFGSLAAPSLLCENVELTGFKDD